MTVLSFHGIYHYIKDLSLTILFQGQQRNITVLHIWLKINARYSSTNEDYIFERNFLISSYIDNLCAFPIYKVIVITRYCGMGK